MQRQSLDRDTRMIDFKCAGEHLRYLQLDTDFFSKFWRKNAVKLRGRAQGLASSEPWISRFEDWCRPPVQARVFATSPDGTSLAAVIDDPAAAHELYQVLAGEGQPVTLLLNHVESADQTIGSIHDALAVGQNWRKGDVVATLSTQASGIGYHAGNEDGFIIQLEGRRHWRAWCAEYTPEAYRRQLLGLPNNRDPKPSRTEADPHLDVILEPGDILYLPPLFAHEGLTLDQSVSLSVAWRGVTPYTYLKALLGDQLATLDDIEGKIDVYGMLLADPPAGAPSAAIWPALTKAALDAVGAGDCLRAAATAEQAGA